MVSALWNIKWRLGGGLGCITENPMVMKTRYFFKMFFINMGSILATYINTGIRKQYSPSTLFDFTSKFLVFIATNRLCV
jgi:hypothetical protein